MAVPGWNGAARSIAATPNFNPPPELNETAAIHAVEAMTQPALDGLKAQMESAQPGSAS